MGMSQTSTVPSQQAVVVADNSALQSVIDDRTSGYSVESYVHLYFKDYPILAEIAGCESHFRQFSSAGVVLRGKAVPADVGVMQINETYQLERAEKNGFNIYTLEGNLAYGKYLYEHQGVAPWMASSACWSHSKIAIAK